MLSALRRGFQSAQEYKLSYAGKQSQLPALTASLRVKLVLYNNTHLPTVGSFNSSKHGCLMFGK